VDAEVDVTGASNGKNQIALSASDGRINGHSFDIDLLV
jgi:hypothetical protein